MVNKRVWNAVLGCNLKNNRMISVHFQGKPWNSVFIHLCPHKLVIVARGLLCLLSIFWDTRSTLFPYTTLFRSQKEYPVVDVTGDRSKVQCYKEQYFIGTWNVRSMNQGKLEVIKQEMVRLSIDILGISELKWTGMSEFHSHDHYIYYYGQESLRRNGLAIMVNKRVWNAVLGCNLKNNRMISVRFQGKPFNILVI